MNKVYYSSERRAGQINRKEEKELKDRHMSKGLKRATRLEIVPVGVVRLSRPRIRRNDTLDTSDLRRLTVASGRSICGTRGGRSSYAPSALEQNRTCARASLQSRLLALLDDLIFAMIGTT
jgi:hypothetical protein